MHVSGEYRSGINILRCPLMNDLEFHNARYRLMPLQVFVRFDFNFAVE